MRILTMAVRIWRQVLRDRRTLALFFLAPVLLLTVLDITLTSPVATPRIAVHNLPAGFQTILKRNATLTDSGPIDGSLVGQNKGRITLTIESVSPSVIQRLRQSVLEAETVYNEETMARNLMALRGRASRIAIPAPGLAQLKPALLKPPVVSYRYPGSAYSNFNQTAPALMALFIFFFVFLVSGIAFLRERVQGTLERLKVSPIWAWEIMTGYLAGFGLIAVLQTLFLQWYASQALAIPSAGAIYLVVLLDVLLAFIALSTGMVLSLFARTEFQVMQFIPLVIIPQIVFSGLFPLRTAPAWVQDVSSVLPVTYAVRGLRAVMLKNDSFSGIAPQIGMLALFFVVLAALNIVLLRKSRPRAANRPAQAS
ncbi:MAG: ABC transporter permease [Bacilli bacterium]